MHSLTLCVVNSASPDFYKVKTVRFLAVTPFVFISFRARFIFFNLARSKYLIHLQDTMQSLTPVMGPMRVLFNVAIYLKYLVMYQTRRAQFQY